VGKKKAAKHKTKKTIKVDRDIDLFLTCHAAGYESRSQTLRRILPGFEQWARTTHMRPGPSE